MGMFQNLRNVKLSADYNYEKQGSYINRIDKVKKGQTRTHEIFLVIEKTVLVVLPSNEPPPHHIVGDEVCHFIMVTGSEYAEKDWAAFMCGLFGCKPEELTPEIFGGKDSDDWATNEDPKLGPVQPCRGMLVENQNRIVPNKKGDGSFTRYKYVRQVTPSEVAKQMNADQIKRFFPAGVAA